MDLERASLWTFMLLNISSNDAEVRVSDEGTAQHLNGGCVRATRMGAFAVVADAREQLAGSRTIGIHRAIGGDDFICPEGRGIPAESACAFDSAHGYRHHVTVHVFPGIVV